MAISENIFKQDATSAGYVNPIIWDDQSEKYLYDGAVFPTLGKIDTRQLNRPGKQFNYQLQGAFQHGLLTPGVPTPVSQVTYTQKVVTFNAYGGAVQFDEAELAQGLGYLLSDAKEGSMNSAVEFRDSIIATELYTSTGTGIYVNGKSSSNIAAGDVLDAATLVKVDDSMKLTQAKKLIAIVIHPKQEYSLRTNAQFITASAYGSDAVIKTGEIGSWQGIKVFISNYITSATENSITVYKAIALGAKTPFVFMPKKQMEFYAEREIARDRAITLSWWEMFGVKVIVDDSVIVVTSATGF